LHALEDRHSIFVGVPAWKETIIGFEQPFDGVGVGWQRYMPVTSNVCQRCLALSRTWPAMHDCMHSLKEVLSAASAFPS
jgi:hypothetical protein